MFKKISKFFAEVKQEFAKVSWPTRNELKGTTIVVMVLTALLALYIFGIDKILQMVLNIIF
ncbi:preprotein translocase subunit SecE [candidate division KSB1 bacterium]|nr:preprotein translocase subunit SecE [candidate division KSB1 bacterium]RQV93914.1 MAG: preprotein translocase subunit SecE [bacterium]